MKSVMNMKSVMRWIFLAVAMTMASCALTTGPEPHAADLQTDEAGLEFSVSIPLLDETLDDSAASGAARIIDPASVYMRITVSSPDMDAYTSPYMPVRMADLNNTTYEDDDIRLTRYEWNWVEGSYAYGHISFNGLLKRVSTGVDRTISISTFDSYYRELSRGSLQTTIDVNQSQTWINLMPLVTTPMAIGQILENQTVAKDRMKYYALTLPQASRVYAIKASSPADVGLFVYDERGNWSDWMRSYQYTEGPVYEAVSVYGDAWQNKKYIIGVLGQSLGVSSFTLQVEELIGQPFPGDLIMDTTVVPLVDYTAESLLDGVTQEPKAGVTELWPVNQDGYRIGRSFQEIDLGFDFIYHGTPYNKVFVSPDGFISFQGFRIYYDWAWYAQYSWRSWYYWFYGGHFPNDIVALYQTRLHFRPQMGDLPASRILWRVDTVVDPESSQECQRLVLEYYNMYYSYDAITPLNSKRLTGRIELIENVDGAGAMDGEILLRYDRANSLMTGTNNIFIGLENDDGRTSYSPWSYLQKPATAGFDPWYWNDQYHYTRYADDIGLNGLPANDIRYALKSGGMTVELE